MMLNRLARPSLLLIVPMLLFGCGKKESALDEVTVDEDVIVNDGDLVVSELIPIPEDKVEVITETRPSKEHVWVPGAWERTGPHWTWQEGHWEKPPHKAAYWRRGHWRWVEGEWHWAPGHWAVSHPSVTIEEVIPVPKALAEEVPPKPSDKNHWVAGYWEWDGSWIWVPGYWTTKPHTDAEWVAGHWDDFGVNGWRWVSGHWRIKKS